MPSPLHDFKSCQIITDLQFFHIPVTTLAAEPEVIDNVLNPWLNSLTPFHLCSLLINIIIIAVYFKTTEYIKPPLETDIYYIIISCKNWIIG